MTDDAGRQRQVSWETHETRLAAHPSRGTFNGGDDTPPSARSDPLADSLVPEEAEVWNVGYSWLVTAGLTITMDYVDIDFRDRLVFYQCTRHS